MNPSEPKPNRNSFFRVMEWPAALSLGALVSFLFSLKQVNPEVRIEWSTGSLIALVIGTGVSWYLARLVFRIAEQPVGDRAGAAEKSRKRKMTLIVIVLAAGTVGSLVYSLKDVSAAKRMDVIIGTGSAFIVIALALYGFWRLVQFLEKHGLPEEEATKDHPEGTDKPE